MKKRLVFAAWAAWGAGLVVEESMGEAAGPDLDLIVANGRIVDGTGAPWFRGDVGVKGDRIVAVGDLSAARAKKKVDAGGHMIAPGFIDMLGQSELNVLIDNRVESKIRQGFTTEITGEGSSVAPIDDVLIAEAKPWLDKYHLSVDWRDLDGYFKRFAKVKSAINLGTYVGAASVRAVVVGLKDEVPTPEQLSKMEQLVETAMKQGAFGLSTALIYPPGSYAKTPELVALAKVAARYGGIYATHMRAEDDKIMDAMDEVFTIAREAKIPVEIWHLKAAKKKNWGRMKEIIARIEEARAEGLDVSANMYPYAASSNGLAASVPEWAQAGGVDAMIGRFHDAETRKRIKSELRQGAIGTEGADSILIVNTVNPALQKYVGLRLADAARAMNKDVEDALMEIVEADRGNTAVVRFAMDEDDVRLGLRQPWISICTDNPGQAIDGPFAKDSAHPRAFGSVPRLFAEYARKEKLFSIEEAVRKMTSLPARRMSLFDRGLLRPGMMADLVVFDPKTVQDRATYEKPLAYGEGIELVAVNGRVVFEGGKMTAERPGRILKGARARGGPG